MASQFHYVKGGHLFHSTDASYGGGELKPWVALSYASFLGRFLTKQEAIEAIKAYAEKILSEDANEREFRWGPKP